MKHLPLLTLVGVLGCAPLQISGASEPTEHTFKLLDTDIAYAEDGSCTQTWVTGDVAADLEAALGILADRRVRIVEGNPIATATALEHKLLVSKKYVAYPDAAKVRVLSHELVHYCHRDKEGDRQFEASYFHSAGRWRTETAADKQLFRTMTIQCIPLPEVEEAMETRLVRMRDFYLLWDIDSEQYDTETRRIWRTVLVEQDHC